MDAKSFTQLVIRFMDGNVSVIEMKDIENISFQNKEEMPKDRVIKVVGTKPVVVSSPQKILIVRETMVSSEVWHRSGIAHFHFHITDSIDHRDEIIAKIEETNKYLSSPHIHQLLDFTTELNKGYLFYRFSTQFNERQGIIGIFPTLEMAKTVVANTKISCPVQKPPMEFTEYNPNSSEEMLVYNFWNPSVNVIMVQDMIIPFDLTRGHC